MRVIIYSYEQFYSRSPRRRIVPSPTTYLGQGPAGIGALVVVLRQGAHLALGTTFSRLSRPGPFFFLILGIFVTIAESNPFFTLP